MFSVTGILYIYYQILFNMASFQARMKREFESFNFKIASASDARSAYTRWMANANEHETIRSLFEAKTEQLERVEARMDEGDRPGLTTIEAGSYFTATYVMKYARGSLEPRKYQIGFDATYQMSDAPSAQSASTATNVQISPYPISLSVVAIVSAMLGVLLRVSLGGSQDPLTDLVLMAKSGQQTERCIHSWITLAVRRSNL